MIHRRALSLFGKYFRGWTRAGNARPVARFAGAEQRMGLKRGSARRKRPPGTAVGPLMSRYVCSSCSSFRGWYAARRLGGRKVFRMGAKGDGGGGPRRGARVEGTDLPRQSLFISLQAALPSAPTFDRYRLVIAFRYLNISARQNLSNEIGGICGEASCQWRLASFCLTWIWRLRVIPVAVQYTFNYYHLRKLEQLIIIISNFEYR